MAPPYTDGIELSQAIRANAVELLQAKFYKLTAAGKKRLPAEQSKWNLLVKAIASVMNSVGGV
jgi:hypothetical protein